MSRFLSGGLLVTNGMFHIVYILFYFYCWRCSPRRVAAWLRHRGDVRDAWRRHVPTPRAPFLPFQSRI